MSVTLSVDLDCAKCYSSIWDEDDIWCRSCAQAPKPRKAVDQFKECLRQVQRVSAMRPDWDLFRVCQQVLADNEIPETERWGNRSELDWHRFPVEFAVKADEQEEGEAT